MYRTFWASFLAIVCAGLSPDIVVADDTAVVQADVKRCVSATYEANVDVAISCTYPKVIQMMGGEEATRSALTAAFGQLKQAGLKLESMVFPKPPTFFRGARNKYVFVPTLSHVSAATGQKLESLNFQLGIFDEAQHKWLYVEGSRVNAANVAVLFEDFPKDVAFPPFYRKKI
jgi:hypothetical protein